jgi:hypothetical protein
MTVEPLYLYFLLPGDEYLEVTTAVPLSRFPGATLPVARRPGPSWVYDREAAVWVDETDPAEALALERASMVCSAFQARAALLGAGLLTAAQAAVDASTPEVQLAWEYAIEWRRTSPTIAALAAALELTDEDVDNLFRAAMLIEA